MSELGPKLKKLREDYANLVALHQAPQFIWQVVTKDSDLVQDAQAYSPVDRHRRPITLPDHIEKRIALFNSGEALLLGGLLRIFIVPASMNLDQVGKLIEALKRRFGGDHSAVYRTTYKILFSKEHSNGKSNR
jgi:hypothetical protein